MARSPVRFVAVITLGVGLALLALPARGAAQTFSSGSTGADGALDLATMNCPGGICEVQLSPSGVMNYTTVNVPQGKMLRYKRNIANTPVYLLAQGAINIAGSIDVSASSSLIDGNNYQRRAPGPGGYWGGAWVYPNGFPGFGPGAGPTGSATWVGPLSLVPLVGGSGGAGGGCSGFGTEGSGGGGAVAVVSSTSIDISGYIAANGGSYFFNPGCGGTWGVGSGGPIRIVANSVNISGGLSGAVVRIEAPPGALNFTGSSQPAAVLSSINPTIFAATPTSLSITSVGGYAVPVNAGQRFDTVDVLLPTQLPDPIAVAVAASNIPVGTSVGVTFGTGNTGSVVAGTLAGTLQASTATIQVSGLSRGALAYLFVSATFQVPGGAAASNPAGPDRVAQVRVTSPPGAETTIAYLRADGTTVDPARLPAAFLSHFQR